jgi:hypothetical protein
VVKHLGATATTFLLESSVAPPEQREYIMSPATRISAPATARKPVAGSGASHTKVARAGRAGARPALKNPLRTPTIGGLARRPSLPPAPAPASLDHSWGWVAVPSPAPMGQILAFGYDFGPAGGPGAGGFHRPRFSFHGSQGRVYAGQMGCGRSWTRCHARVIASAHGQFAAIFSRLRRPPCTSRAAAWRTLYLL